jgi:hypothetical protein
MSASMVIESEIDDYGFNPSHKYLRRMMAEAK